MRGEYGLVLGRYLKVVNALIRKNVTLTGRCPRRYLVWAKTWLFVRFRLDHLMSTFAHPHLPRPIIDTIV
jgi:hypothetical protein